MPETDLHPDVVKAIQRVSATPLGRRFDRYARKNFHIPGWKLAAKQTAGEFGGRSTETGRGVVSSAGARGPAQFIPSTRDAYIRQYGVDPWKNDRAAIKGLMLHDLNTGVAGYNPGMPTYTGYVLGQHLNAQDRRALRGGAPGSAPGQQAGLPSRPGRGTLKLSGPTSTTVGLQSTTTPGQSFAPERDQARMDLLLGGPLNLQRLLAYKQTINSLADVPASTSSDLVVKRRRGAGVKVGTKTPGGRATTAPASGKLDTSRSRFDGKPVAAWMAPALAYARAHGWKGTVTSGFRTPDQQMAAARSFGLQHYGPAGPLGSNHVFGHSGAVDVSDPDGLERALRGYRGRKPIRRMSDDPVHFSATGH